MLISRARSWAMKTSFENTLIPLSPHCHSARGKEIINELGGGGGSPITIPKLNSDFIDSLPRDANSVFTPRTAVDQAIYTHKMYTNEEKTNINADARLRYNWRLLSGIPRDGIIQIIGSLYVHYIFARRHAVEIRFIIKRECPVSKKIIRTTEWIHITFSIL